MQKPAPIDDPALDRLRVEVNNLVNREQVSSHGPRSLRNQIETMLLDAHTAGRNYCRAVVLAAIDTAASGYGSDAANQNALADAVRAHREAFVRFQRTTSHSEDLMVAVREVDATLNAMFAILHGTPAPTPAPTLGQVAATGVLRTLRDAARAVVAAQAAGYRDGGAAVRAAIDAMARLLPPKDPTP